jgi:hypothetical protein
MILLIFCIVLFFYLHVHFQLKTSNDLEIYDIYQPSKEKLEEICDLRQPVVFQFNNEIFIETCTQKMASETYGAFDINIRNTKQDPIKEDIYKQVELKKALILMEKDTEEKIIIENNNDFLDETGMVKHYKYNDSFLRPFMVSECKYDFIAGSKGSYTPFRYDLNYRNYYLVTEGSIRIKIAPPKSTKYMYSIDDYDNFEFRSPINCWNVQTQYAQEFNKVKCMDFTVNKGQIVFIPAYWWVSILFESPTTTVCSFKYKTFMNTVSILPKLFIRLLHRQNNIKIALEKSLKRIAGNNIEELTAVVKYNSANDIGAKATDANEIIVSKEIKVKESDTTPIL